MYLFCYFMLHFLSEVQLLSRATSCWTFLFLSQKTLHSDWMSSAAPWQTDLSRCNHFLAVKYKNLLYIIKCVQQPWNTEPVINFSLLLLTFPLRTACRRPDLGSVSDTQNRPDGWEWLWLSHSIPTCVHLCRMPRRRAGPFPTGRANENSRRGCERFLLRCERSVCTCYNPCVCVFACEVWALIYTYICEGLNNLTT